MKKKTYACTHKKASYMQIIIFFFIHISISILPYEVSDDTSIVRIVNTLLSSSSINGALIGRLGNAEMIGIRLAKESQNSREVHVAYNQLNRGPGVYATEEYNKQREVYSFMYRYMSAIDACDALTCPGVFFERNNIAERLYYPRTAYILRVRYLLPHLLLPLFENCTVLVICPFSRTIQDQWRNVRAGRVFGPNVHIPSSMQLKTVSTFYTTSGNTPPHSGWTETLHVLEQRIHDVGHFDVALIGAGGYGMPLGYYIKTQLKRVAICTGGFTEAYFGIKYKRLVDQHAKLGLHSFLDNDTYWVYPRDEERPKNMSAFLYANDVYW